MITASNGSYRKVMFSLMSGMSGPMFLLGWVCPREWYVQGLGIPEGIYQEKGISGGLLGIHQGGQIYQRAGGVSGGRYIIRGGGQVYQWEGIQGVGCISRDGIQEGSLSTPEGRYTIGVWQVYHGAGIPQEVGVGIPEGGYVYPPTLSHGDKVVAN